MLGAISAGAFFSGIAANPVYAGEEDESITEAAEAKDIDEQTLLDEGVDEGGENKEDKKTIEGNNQYETINGGDSAIQTEKAEELQLTDEENVKTTGGVGAVNSYSATSSFESTAETKNGWVRENGAYYYYKNGTKYTGWHYMTSAEGEKTPHWSFFGSDGKLRTGWVQLGKGTANPDGNSARHWSYFGDNGWLRTGWVQMGKGTSNPDGNSAKHWSFFGDNGWLRTGWVQLGKGTSNPDGNSAKHWSYFGDNGWQRTGWVQLGKGTSNPDGNAAKHWSYFGSNGWLRTEWVQFGKGTSEPDGNAAKHWSYFGPNGWLRTGWQDMGKGTSNPDGNSAKHRSYFGDNGWMRTGMQLIAGKKYEFDGRGWLRYSDASIPPKEQPEDIWDGIYNIEVRFNNGVHLYLPSFSTGYFYEGWEPHGNFGWDYFPEGGNNRLIYFNFIGEKVYSGQKYFKVNTNTLHVTAQEAEIDIAVGSGNSVPLDNQFNTYRTIGTVGGKSYYIEFSMPSSWNSYWYGYNSEYYREFAGKIVNSAWVE